ncbi:MAG: type I restriction enzyme HsdR N-terminal domain-containing protein, partial [Desulfobacterales bacterium]
PRLKITHQKYLPLRVGHRTDIKTGGAKQAVATGRLDILISFENKPLAVLEIKEPGKPLTKDDRDQGLSYAKLLLPQASLVIVSNGEDAEFYQTFDGEVWNPSNKDENAVHALFSHALSSAADELEEAIRLLMGKQPSIWKSLFQKYTEAAIYQLAGEVDQYSHPLTMDFVIKRSVVSEIANSITDGDTLLALIGPPLSGKTNVLSQVCMTADMENLVPIYIDAQNTSYGIFQHIANQFTRELYVQVQPSEIRHWIFNSIQSISGHLAIIIDGWTAGISGTLKEDVEELINFLQPDLPISVLLCMDDTAFQEIKNTPGRPTCSAIGRNAKVIQLNPLDDNEFESVCRLFYDKFQTGFHHGAQYNLDYRIPRLLRLIANTVNRDESEAFVNKDYTQIKVFPSITNFLIFGSWDQYISHPEIAGFFQDLARAYILDRDNRIDDPALSIMSHGKGHIVRETAEKVIGIEKLNTMRAQGHIGIVRGPNGKVLILPKIPEFLATAASHVIGNHITHIDWLNQFVLQRVFASAHYSILAAIFPAQENHGLILPGVSGKL